MAVPEPSDNVGFWETVKNYSIDQLWPPDDEQDAWDLAAEWRAVAALLNDTATELENQADIAVDAWTDIAGVQFEYLLRTLPENFRLVAENMDSLAVGLDDYGNSLREARINIVIELVVNIGLFAALAWLPGGGFLAQGLARVVAGRLTSMITTLAGRALGRGLTRAIEMGTRLSVEIGKEAFDEAFINTTTQLTSMAMGTRDNFDFEQLGKATAAGAVGGVLGEGLGKLTAPLTRATNAGLNRVLPDNVARNVTAGVTSFGNNAITSPSAGYIVENYNNPAALTDLGGYADSIRQNGIAAGLMGAPRSMVVDAVQQMHPGGEALVNDWADRLTGNAPPPEPGAGGAPGDGQLGGDPAGGQTGGDGGTGTGGGTGAGAGSGGAGTGAGTGQAGAGGTQAGGAGADAGGTGNAGADTGGTQTGNAGAEAGGTQSGDADAAGTGNAGADAGGTQTGGADAGGTQTGETGANTGGTQTGSTGADAGGTQTGNTGADAGGTQTSGTGAEGTQTGNTGADTGDTQTSGTGAEGTQTGNTGADTGDAQTSGTGADTSGTHTGSTGTETGGHGADSTQAGGTGADTSVSPTDGTGASHTGSGQSGVDASGSQTNSENTQSTPAEATQSNAGTQSTGITGTAPVGSTPTHTAVGPTQSTAPTQTTSTSQSAQQTPSQPNTGQSTGQSNTNQSQTSQSQTSQSNTGQGQPAGPQTGKAALPTVQNLRGDNNSADDKATSPETEQSENGESTEDQASQAGTPQVVVTASGAAVVAQAAAVAAPQEGQDSAPAKPKPTHTKVGRPSAPPPGPPPGPSPAGQPDVRPFRPLSRHPHRLGAFSENRLGRDAQGRITTIDGVPVEVKLRQLAETRVEQYWNSQRYEDSNRYERHPHLNHPPAPFDTTPRQQPDEALNTEVVLDEDGDATVQDRNWTENVMALAIDVLTGDVFEALNGPTEHDEINDKVKARREEVQNPGGYPKFDKKGNPKPGETHDMPYEAEPFDHAEIRAVNEGLNTRPNAEFSDFVTDVQFLRGAGVKPAWYCANCAALLHDVPTNAGKRVYTENLNEDDPSLDPRPGYKDEKGYYGDDPKAPPRRPTDPPPPPTTPPTTPPDDPPPRLRGTLPNAPDPNATPDPSKTNATPNTTNPNTTNPNTTNPNTTNPAPPATGPTPNTPTASGTTPDPNAAATPSANNGTPTHTTTQSAATTPPSGPPPDQGNATPPTGATPTPTTSGGPPATPPGGPTSATGPTPTTPQAGPPTVPPGNPANTPPTGNPAGPSNTTASTPTATTPPTNTPTTPQAGTPTAPQSQPTGSPAATSPTATPTPSPTSPNAATANTPAAANPTTPRASATGSNATTGNPAGSTPNNTPTTPHQAGTTPTSPTNNNTANAPTAGTPTTGNTPTPPQAGTPTAPQSQPTGNPAATSPTTPTTPPTGPNATTANTSTTNPPTAPRTGTPTTPPAGTPNATPTNTQANTPTTPNAAPAPQPNTPATPGPRSRVEAVPRSRFGVRARATANHMQVKARAHTAMLAVAGDVGVRSITSLGWNRFEVTRLDGTTFQVRVTAEETGDVAEVEVTGPDSVHIRVSAKAAMNIIERAVAGAVARADALLSGTPATDLGRQAEERNLARTKQEASRFNVVRRQRVASEMKALAQHLGVPGPNTPPAPPNPPGNPNSPGPRSRVQSVQAVPHSRFGVNAKAAPNHMRVKVRAHAAMLAVAQDAEVRSITSLGWNRFEVTRLDGTTFQVRVTAEEIGGQDVAEVEVTGANTAHITVSARADLSIVERAVAGAVARADAMLSGTQTTKNVLDGNSHPGSTTELSVADRGRQAEARNLARAKQEASRFNVARRQRITSEMKALVEHLGVHPDDDVSPQRLAVADLGAVVDRHVKPGSRRPAWALPPTGYPSWRAFLRIHMVAEMAPGLAAGAAIWATGAPVVGMAVGVAAVATAVSGTLIKRWYGRRDKTNTDTGHGVAGKQREYEAALRRKQLLDPLLARLRNVTVPGPAEPAPDNDWPATHQSYPARLLARGGPAVVGAAAASLLAFAGLPVWSVVSHWGVATFAVVVGPVVEKYLRKSLVRREWKLLDDVGREKDQVAAEFDEMFVGQLSALLDRIEHLQGRTPTGGPPTADPVAPADVNETGVHRYGANLVSGQFGDIARAGSDAASKIQAGSTPGPGNPSGQLGQGAINAAIDSMLTGTTRALLGTIINAFLDRQFITNEYKAILEQVHFDFGGKMAEQVALEQRVLNEMMAELTAHVDAAEAAVRRVNTTLSSRVADLQAATPPAPTPGNPQDRPLGHQRWQAFLKLHSKQAAVMEGLMVGSALAFSQGRTGMIVIGAVSAAIASAFGLRYLFRHTEQLAVDETIRADRAKERPVEQAEANARKKFLVDLWTRAITGQTLPTAPPKPPKVETWPRRHAPDYAEKMAQHAAHERDRLFHEPRPWSTLGARLVGLDRMDRMVQRVKDFRVHAQNTGDTRAYDQATMDLHRLWTAYQELRDEGKPLPTDHELLANEKPEGLRGGHQATRPAGELRSYLDNSVETPAGRAFYAPGDVLLVDADRVPPEPGVYTVDVHGGPDHVRIGDDRLTPEDLAAILRADPNWHGEPIRLLACETGQDPNGFAQQLADLLGVRVQAPSDFVGLSDDGQLYVTTTEVDSAGRVRVVQPATGMMRTFEPRVTPESDPNLPSEPPERLRGPAPPVRHHYGTGFWWPERDEVDFGEMTRPRPVEDLGELTLMRDGQTVYASADQLWPDELAEIVAARDGWAGGPTRLQVTGGHVDPTFVQRLADLLGRPVVIPADAVAGDFPALSSGTLEVYNEPDGPTAPGCVVYEPRSVSAGKGTTS